MIVVEVLDQRGGVRGRTRLDTFPATIGRAYDCDVILDDPYVCPCHLRIVASASGELYAEDAGSVNGLRARGARDRVPRVALDADSELCVGRTVLRVRDASRRVPPALADRASAYALVARLESPLVSVAVCLVALAVFALQSYLQSFERSSAPKAVGAAMGILFALALWAGIWSVVGRAVSHQFHFLRHLALVALAALGALVVSESAEWLEFLAPGSAASAVLGVTGLLALVVVLLAAHLAVASSLSPGRRLRWAAGVTVGFMALAALMAYADHDKFTSRLDDPGSVKPFGARWVRAESASDFAAGALTLQQKVDSLARERD